jgi:hypothetical protein
MAPLLRPVVREYPSEAPQSVRLDNPLKELSVAAIGPEADHVVNACVVCRFQDYLEVTGMGCNAASLHGPAGLQRVERGDVPLLWVGGCNSGTQYTFVICEFASEQALQLRMTNGIARCLTHPIAVVIPGRRYEEVQDTLEVVVIVGTNKRPDDSVRVLVGCVMLVALGPLSSHRCGNGSDHSSDGNREHEKWKDQ